MIVVDSTVLDQTLIAATKSVEALRTAARGLAPEQLEVLRIAASGQCPDAVEQLVIAGSSNRNYVTATSVEGVRLTAGLLLATHEAAARFEPKALSEAVWAFAWSWTESAVVKALARPRSWSVAVAGCRYAGRDAIRVACQDNLRAPAEALCRGAKWLFLAGEDIDVPDAELFAAHPAMCNDGDAGVIPFAERLVAAAGVPSKATVDWLSGLPVRVIQRALGLAELPGELLAALGAEGAVPLVELADALQAVTK